MSDEATSPAVSVRDAGKMYRIYAQPQDRLKQMMLGRMGRTYGQDFWALRHVSFDVARGERFGVIGRNGSGKSTLLQLIAGTLAPTEGTVEIDGRVSALLELGSGFNPEFTGRENVFINAAIHGLSREQVEGRFDAIAAFADIGAFLEQPVKLYSSGMFVRLAFAVGTSIDADVLLIDEALAVGDVFFRQKCYRRLDALRERGVAIVLVSHAMGDIEEFCDRALLLDHGTPVLIGPSNATVKRYYIVEQQTRIEAMGTRPAEPSTPAVAASSPGEWSFPAALEPVPDRAQVTDGFARCLGALLTDEAGRPCGVFEQGARAIFWFEFELLRDADVPIVGVVIQNDRGTIVHGKSTLETDTTMPTGLRRGARLRVRQGIALEIGLGEYTYEIGLAMIDREVHSRRDRSTHAELMAAVVRLCAVPGTGTFVVVFRRPVGQTQLLHHGAANLPGEIRVMAVTASDTSSVTGASITASGDHEAWPAVPAAAMLQATTPKAHPTITPEHALTAREVLDGCRAIADLYPFNPSMILWRGWEYAAYRRFTLPSPVLDIGCGDGRFFRFVFPACLDVVGVEMDANVAAHARASGVYRDVHQIPAHTLPASDERFGSAFANCSLEHMECLPSVLKGVYESLTPGAPFLCSVVTDRFVQWSPWPTLLEAAGDSDRGREVQRTHERFHHLANPLTREAWHRAFTDAGFVIEKEIPIIPEQTARLFLFVDQFVHLPRPDGEWFDPMVGYLERLPEFSSGFLRVLDGVLSMETDWQDAIGLVLYMRRPA